MLPLFLYPLAFLGLLAIPALVAIYLLRHRFRRYTVSSLMLWRDPRDPRQGGTRINRLQTPLLFLLELLMILLLVIAAAEPRIPSNQTARPLVVVLDDSFSMRAGGADSPRARALEALRKELRAYPYASFRFVLAGETSVVLGDTVHSIPEALDLLDGWSCRAPAARLQEALSLSSELGGTWARLLVLTDHEPWEVEVPEKGRLQWWAFGRRLPNRAFVSAARTARDGAERCLFEVANLSSDPGETNLTIEAGTPPTLVQRSRLQMEPGQTRRIILQLKEDTPVLHARLDDDDLDIDNAVTLLPVAENPVRTDVDIRDGELRRLLDRGVRSIREATRTGERPELIFTDRTDPEPPPGAWIVSVLAEKDALSYNGPFVLDRAHPLTEGLSLQGVVWGAGKTEELPGAPVVLAGNVPLLCDSEMPGLRHHVTLRLRPDLSTLPDTPAWPVILQNLIDWRAALRPGLSRPNIRLGEDTTLTLAADRDDVEIKPPSGSPRRLPVQERRVVVRGDEAGLWTLRAGTEEHRFAVNTLARDESDLTGCGTGTWGDWLDETTLRRDYQSIAWAFLLLALGVATIYLLLVARQWGRNNP
jgi:hypothetical protein